MDTLESIISALFIKMSQVSLYDKAPFGAIIKQLAMWIMQISLY